MKIIISLIIVLNIALTGFQFFLTTVRSSDGKKLWSLQTELSSLAAQNSDLKNQIAIKTSLSQVFSDATSASLSALPVTQATAKSVAALP